MKTYNFLKTMAVIALLGCSTVSMAQATSEVYFVDHEPIKPGSQMVIPYSVPSPQYYLECWQEGGAPNETKALATMTWNYKGGEFGAMIDGNKRYGRLVALKTEYMKNSDPIAKLADKTGKIKLENIGKVTIVVGCRYTEEIY